MTAGVGPAAATGPQVLRPSPSYPNRPTQRARQVRRLVAGDPSLRSGQARGSVKWAGKPACPFMVQHHPLQLRPPIATLPRSPPPSQIPSLPPFDTSMKVSHGTV